MSLCRIVSGGQSGGDMAGLLAARLLGLPTGGWAPRGWLVETADGRDDVSSPWLADYGLRECPMPLGNVPVNDGGKVWREFRRRSYVVRTEFNARDSDGTIWFGSGDSRGFDCTQRNARKYDRPFLFVVGGKTKPSDVRAWLAEHDIKTLNVAGNRASSQPTRPGETSFQDRVVQFLLATLKDHQHVST